MAITYDGATKSIYLNDVLDSVQSDSSAFINLAVGLNIGRHANTGYPAYFNGSIDDINIWDEAISVPSVPEPQTLALTLMGLLGLGGRTLTRKR